MEFKPFIYNAKQEQIPVSIAPMTDADAQKKSLHGKPRGPAIISPICVLKNTQQSSMRN